MQSNLKNSTGMIIDGVAASEVIDSSGEKLSVKGCDISDWEEGKGLLNWEHRAAESHGASPSDIVGRILYAKKIFNEDDCDDDRQTSYWKQVNAPFIYIIGRLYDGAGHSGASDLAAQIRDHTANGEKIMARLSIEGNTLSRKGNVLEESVARVCAITVKPCNKTCNTGVLKDPNAPDGYDKSPVKKDLLADIASKAEESAIGHKLGGSVELECDPEIRKSEEADVFRSLLKLKLLKKAIAAGVGSAAPSSLVQGAALSREEIDPKVHSHYKSQILAAIRDFDEPFDKKKFRSFLKHRLPDVGEGFLDHFADVADDIKVKMKKSMDEAPESKEPKKSFAGTAMGKKLRPIPSLAGKGASINTNTGVVRTRYGTFKLHNPDEDKSSSAHFQDLLHEPKVEEFHGHVMENWAQLHDRLKQKRMPPEVLMHAAVFSMLSPTTPVHQQEMEFSRYADALKNIHTDPRDPNFREKFEPEWYKQDNPKQLPEHSREYWEQHPSARQKSASKINPGTGEMPRHPREAGDVIGYSMDSQKVGRISNYHKMHDYWANLIKEHPNAEEAVGRFLADKKANPELLGGLDQKTALYMMGMLGAGDMAVPDTHFLRHVFGLENKTDKDTITKIKQDVWNNYPLMRGINQWYAEKHPAVKHMQEHPRWGHLFRDDPKSAVFPAFWKHWAVIGEHEKRRGMVHGTARNLYTTHQPYFEAALPHLARSEEGAKEPLPIRTAKQHLQWVKEFGEIPAMSLYFKHLAPMLLASAEDRENAQFQKSIAAIESLYIELKKTMAGPMDPDLPDSTIDSERHVPKHAMAISGQKELVHGANPMAVIEAPGHTKGGVSNPLWIQTPSGRMAITKPRGNENYGLPNNEVAYHNLAHQFFGLGHYVPLTTSYNHPVTGETYSMQEAVPGASHMPPLEHGQGHENLSTIDPLKHGQGQENLSTIDDLGNSGELHKLAIMNMAMGNVDRHDGNWVFTNKGKIPIKLIDNGMSFHTNYGGANEDWATLPSYLRYYGDKEENQKLHPKAEKWLSGLDHRKFYDLAIKNGVAPHLAEQAALRLMGMQNAAAKYPSTIKDLFHASVKKK